MKSADPKKLALYVSLIICGFYSLVYIVCSFFWIEFDVIFFFSFLLLLFFFCFIIFRFFVEKFIYEKIKLIYKTIHTSRTPEDAQKQSRKDLLNVQKVDLEVKQWATDQEEEISQLKKMETFRRDFLGNVSHELKTPIFNIQGYVLTLLDGGLEDKTINREYLLRTEKSIDRMITIVEDLETISKLESGAEKLKIIKFDLLQMTKDVVEFLEMKAKQKNIHISFAANYEKPVFVMADRQQINQVMINLIDNSLKYGNENGKTKISFFDMDENILVEITDDGIGIDLHDVPRIFERFYRTDKGRSREQGGSGLGLAIVKHIIEAHKQTVNVRSALGAGTTFAFTLKKG